MRNKSPLSLIEQLLMVLIFALAAALCLQGFVLANRISTGIENRNTAVTMAQNAAELVKYHTGDLTKISLPPEDSEDSTSKLHLEITPLPSSTPLLGTAQIRVWEGEEIIFEITAAWQEEENANAKK